MAIRITCPGCKTSLTLDDDKRGQKVRCDNCDKALNIPAASGAKREKEMAVQNGQKVKIKASAATETVADRDDEEEAPKKKKKKKKQAGADMTLWFIIGGVAVFLLALGGGGWAVLSARKDPPPPEPEGPKIVAKAEDKEKGRSGTRIIIPSREEGNPANPTKKGGTGVINNVRGSAWRAERKNEMRTIGQYYVQYCEEYKGANRNMMTFKEYIKTAPSTIREPIEEGYYVMNFKADPIRDTQCIVAYERDEDNQGFKGHLAVKGDTSVDYVPTPELKASLGK